MHTGGSSDDTIDKVFNKKRPDDRKTWLENYDKKSYLNIYVESVKTFIEIIYKI